MLGKKEIWYFGYATLALILAFTLAYLRPDSLMGFAAVLVPIVTGLYGGGLGKLYVESKNGNGNGTTKTQ